MPFLIVLVVLALERFVNLQKVLKRFSWFESFAVFQATKLKPVGYWGVFAGLILILPVLILLVNGIAILLFHGAANFLIGVLVLLYCLGPKDLFHTLQRYVEERKAGEPMPELRERSANLLSGVAPTGLTDLDTAVAKAAFGKFNTRIASVVFWYALLGPFGAVFYRNIAQLILVKEDTVSQYREILEQAVGVLDWLPARLVALLYALAGSFRTSLKPWQDNIFAGYSKNQTILEECGMASAGFAPNQNEDQSMQNIVETAALLDRCLIVYAIVIVVLLVVF